MESRAGLSHVKCRMHCWDLQFLSSEKKHSREKKAKLSIASKMVLHDRNRTRGEAAYYN